MSGEDKGKSDIEKYIKEEGWRWVKYEDIVDGDMIRVPREGGGYFTATVRISSLIEVKQ